MRPKSMILILIALGCGLIASIGISQVVERGSGNDVEEIETSPIYVAAMDIDIGRELSAQSVKLEEWPIDRIPPGAVATAEQLEGMAPRQRLFEGEPILIGKLASKDSLTGAAERIQPGYRVISVKVAMDTAVSGLIQPGNHVDILAFVRGQGRGGVPTTATILSNVEVFAINDVIEKQLNVEGGSLQAKTVSLQVTPDDARKLVSYAERGRLRLTLRSPDDTEETETIDEFETKPTKVVPIVPTRVVVEEREPGFQMQVLDGTGHARVFEFGEDGELPQELTASTPAGNPSTATTSPVPPFTPPGGAEGLEPTPPVTTGDSDEEGVIFSDDELIDETKDLNYGIEF